MKITKTPSGKYTCCVVLPGADGKRHKKRFTCRTKDECRREANDYLNAHRLYTESMLFRDAAERFVASREAVLSPSTIRAYRVQINVLLTQYEAFSRTSCDRITSGQLQELVNDMTQKGRTPKTVKNYVAMISAILNREKIRLPDVTLPKLVRTEFPCPTPEDMREILRLTEGTPLEIPVRLGILSCRASEISALTAEDVSGLTVHVHRAMVYNSDNVYIIKETPKTDRSNRYISVPESLAKKFPKSGRLTRLNPRQIYERYDKLLAKNALPPYRFHDCRHFFASYCHDIGIPDADILVTGGWSTDHVMKSIYRHALSRNTATAAMQAFISE